MRKFTTLLLLLLLCGAAAGHDYVPAPAQSAPILLKGGTLFTISDGVKPGFDLLMVEGRIAQIGDNLTPPENAEIIDVTGKHVYPGLIAAGTQIGLVEIGAVRATKDECEVGRVNPDVQSHMAYNPDSEIIPTVRSNGVAYAQVVPTGSMIRGRSCLLNLDAWTKEDAAEKLEVGLHISWPTVAVRTSWDEKRSPEEQKRQMAENRRKLAKAFDDARAYATAKAANPDIDIDSRWEALLPVLTADIPVFMHAGDRRQIEQAMQFCNERRLRMVLVGGEEAWKVTDLLVKNDVPVIYARSHSLPMRSDDNYDQAYKIPALLHEAGVKICFGVESTWPTRNMPFDAGHAVAFGLEKDAALRAMTLTPAEVFGVAESLGSLEVGKKASVIVSEGDIMDHLSHNVTHMFIEGRAVDLDNKHKELYRKYRSRSIE
ncbi:MAG: amidohydrolase family protein [bacterium]|nr:amidohydrolase family protein [bacterium]